MFFRKIKEINPKERPEYVRYDKNGRLVEPKEQPIYNLKI